MSATLTWLDLTTSDRDRMRQILELFGEKGTVDEMGLGTLRDALADALFPGVNTIQTRLRYALFVPWIYRALEEKRTAAADLPQRLRREEIALIEPLLNHKGSWGAIGRQSRGSLNRLPSSVYWTALVRWGLFRRPQSQNWYHTHFADLARRRGVSAAADPGADQSRPPHWHPRLPDPPSAFPGEASFDLTREEAEFLQGRLEDRCAGTLLAWMAREGTDAPDNGDFWDDSAALQVPERVPTAVRKVPEDIRVTIELARRFSLHVEGMALLYNLMLAERFREKFPDADVLMKDDVELVDHYRNGIAVWAVKEAAEEDFDPSRLWAFVAARGGRVPPSQRKFVEGWSSRLPKAMPAVAEDRTLRSLVERREQRLKRPRARLQNTTRLRDWNGRPVGIGRMDFRWRRARPMLQDLHQGLRRKPLKRKSAA